MVRPPEFNEIIAKPLSEADKDQFLAEQEFIRDIEWCAKHKDLFSEVAK